MKMAISATQLKLFFAIVFAIFSRLHRTNFSQIPQDLSLSFDPVGFAIFTTRIHGGSMPTVGRNVGIPLCVIRLLAQYQGRPQCLHSR